jgi:hypothetical protein
VDERDGGRRGRRSGNARWLAGLALLALLGGPGGWLVTDHLERDNDFCNACHLTPELPLHLEIRRGFDAEPPVSLASAHGGSVVDSRSGAEAAFRCIDCHGGTGLVGRARVKLLAALDGFWYATGRFDEPDHMAWPLHDADCAKCHAQFDATPSESWQTPRFHELAVHNVEMPVGCVECHRVHEPGADAGAHFLHADLVRGRCARCHMEFEEEP